ncbi:MAG: helix-turn-helix transcriptional regulator [Acidobacteriia bacterium]|nr:helix-turn-helix transcriptional regulator [Terriglobia bacterium]
MKNQTDPRSRRLGSLAWLAEVYFAKGRGAAQDQLGLVVPEAVARPYSVVKAGGGQTCLRTDAEASDHISYEGFNPPPLWEAPYAVYRVRFERAPKHDFMFHSGEEMLIPISGEIVYHFYWSPGGEPPKHEILNPPLRRNSVIRIDPQVPHHTWAAGKGGAEAWMVFRHGSNGAAAIGLDTGPRSQMTSERTTPRRIKLEDLQGNPGKYALVAWGVAEKVRLYRQRANLTTAQLAAICDVHPSYLSRVEEARTNVSLELLLRVARVLHMGLEEVFAPPGWCREIGLFPRPNWKEGPRGPQPVLHKPPGSRHFVHPIYWSLRSSQSATSNERNISSWIVLEGRAIFEMPEASVGGPGSQRSELLETGSVIHLRGVGPIGVQALENTELLQIVYSAGDCLCLDAHLEESDGVRHE